MNILDIEALTKIYKQGESDVKVLSDLNLSVQEGETVAVLGPSGSGKSTFLSLVSGLDRATKGHVKIKGRDLSTLSQKELAQFRAQNVGIVFQNFNLMQNLTALENVLLPLQLFGQKDGEPRAKELLARVGLGHRLNHFPSQLSGGENQRVAIARALIVKPSLLLADEPSGNLDSNIGAQVMNLLFELVAEQKSTLLLVTHNEELALRCDRQLHLRSGHFQ